MVTTYFGTHAEPLRRFAQFLHPADALEFKGALRRALSPTGDSDARRALHKLSGYAAEWVAIIMDGLEAPDPDNRQRELDEEADAVAGMFNEDFLRELRQAEAEISVLIV